MKRLYTIIVLALLLVSANSGNGQTGDDYFARGLSERDQGNHREALTVWSEGWNNNRESGDADPRIGIAFVELAAQIKDRSFYERATAIYMWAFSWNSVIGPKLAPGVRRFKAPAPGDHHRRCMRACSYDGLSVCKKTQFTHPRRHYCVTRLGAPPGIWYFNARVPQPGEHTGGTIRCRKKESTSRAGPRANRFRGSA